MRLAPFTTKRSMSGRAVTTSIAVSLLWVFSSAALISCEKAPSRCGPGQTFDTVTLKCACPTGQVAQGEACVNCGLNEVANGQTCVCASGYVRPTPAEACVSIQSLGDGSVTGTICSGSAECATGTYCDLTGSPPVCRLPPTGQGTPCASNADCAAFEANFCETQVSKTCLVRDCSPTLNNCTDDRQCCDYKSMNLPTLCTVKVWQGAAVTCP